MKFISAFVVIFFVFCKSNKAQSIVAGQHSVSDYFYDYDPDKAIHGYNITDSLDINNDSIKDFVLRTVFTGNPLIFTVDRYVLPLNNSQFSFGFKDTCFSIPSVCGNGFITRNIIGTYNINELIDGNAVWMDSLMYLSFDVIIVGSNGSACIMCEEYVHDTTSFYFGARVFALNDTLYGWVKVKGLLKLDITIEEYACNRNKNINVNTLENPQASIVGPNPFTDKLNIRSNYSQPSEIIIFDSTSKMILRKQFVQSVTLNTENFSEGLYFYEVKSSTSLYKGKLVKY